MRKLWLTYAWTDNDEQDIDYCVQRLTDAGLNVNLDRFNLSAGYHLWAQIEQYITDPAYTDAWLIFATPNSLASKKCQEELQWALNRALEERGISFPLLALFPTQVGNDLIPAPIKSRLFVSLEDDDWVERILAAVEGRQPNISTERLEPYSLTIHQDEGQSKPYSVELRPRPGAAKWSPFLAAVPADEAKQIDPGILPGPKNRPFRGAMVSHPTRGYSHDGNWYVMTASDEASPEKSYYLICRDLPSKLVFGNEDGPQYSVELSSSSTA